VSGPGTADLGRRIRRLRLERGLTLKQIEASVGVSATHVSEVERGKTSPTIGALARIAEALDVRPSHLIDFPVGAPITVTRPGERMVLSGPEGSAECEVLLNGSPDAELSLFLVRLRPGFPAGIPGEARDGDSIVHVVEGPLLVRIGDEEHRVESGGTLHFRASRPQRLINPGEHDCRVLWATWPRFSL
jgi:transcriptional regulator with XRE-family HTH domain